MSLQIDLTKPLTEYEVQYLTDRGDYRSLAENAAILKGHEFIPADTVADPAEQDTLEQATPTPPEEDIVDPVLEDKPASRKK